MHKGLHRSEKIAIVVYFLIAISSLYWNHLGDGDAPQTVILTILLVAVAVLFRIFWGRTWAASYRADGTGWWIFCSVALIAILCIVDNSKFPQKDDSSRDYTNMVYSTVRQKGTGDIFTGEWAWPWQRLDRLPPIAVSPNFQGEAKFADGNKRIVQIELILEYDPAYATSDLQQRYRNTSQTVNYICDELDKLCQRDYQRVHWNSLPSVLYPLNLRYVGKMPDDLAEYKKMLEQDVQAPGFLPGLTVKFAEILPMAVPICRP